MEKQFGKPLTLKGLNNGDLGDKKYSLSRLSQSEGGKNGGEIAKKTGQFLQAAAKGREVYANDPRLKKNAKIMGCNQGKINVNNGHLQKVRDPKKAAIVCGAKLRTCERCGKLLKGNAAMSMHKIYHENFDNFVKLVTNQFSIKSLTSILMKLDLTLDKKKSF
jgi:hypothetical protein